MTDSKVERQALRQHFRQQRNHLTDLQQEQSSEHCLQVCLQSGLLEGISVLAAYLANDGELNPCEIIQHCWQHKIEVLLPVLHPTHPGHLVFVHYREDSILQPNKFGIPEPIATEHNIVALENIDLIFTPLVAFDIKGNRLGMGGGFYDRTLAPIKTAHLSTKLVGLAHECQLAESLPSEVWDIPLHGIASPTRFFRIE